MTTRKLARDAVVEGSALRRDARLYPAREGKVFGNLGELDPSMLMGDPDSSP